MSVFIRKASYSGPLLAAVLDWAGTAVDYGCHGPVSVFVEVFRRKGVEVTIPEARAPMGLMKRDHIAAMCAMESVGERWETIHGKRPGTPEVDEMYAWMEPLMASCIAGYSDPIPGLLDTVETFRAMGMKIGSTTGYTRPMMAELSVAAASKGYAPDSVVCSSDVPAGRPYPWMCLLTAIRLQVYPMEAMVKIGDTVTDIQEGLNAGMWTIGITQTGNELGLTEAEVAALDPAELEARLEGISQRFLDAGAHYVVESITDCPPLIETINARLAWGETPLDR